MFPTCTHICCAQIFLAISKFIINKKENVRAKLRLKIKTLLKRYKYPPDEQVTAVETVLQQAETLGEELVAS